MVAFAERTPHEQETLIFPDAEKAQEFRDEVAERVKQQPNDIRQDRELIAAVVADELAAAGEGGHSLEHPWQHTPEEHSEVQDLVDAAFGKDVTAALKMARKSEYYPRNIDLLHDTLTTELYEGLVEHKVNRQPLVPWLMAMVGIGAVATIVIILLWTAA